MARYVRDVQLNQPEDFVAYMMNDFLTKHGFSLVDFKGQKVFRAGGGFIEIPKFLVYNYQNGNFHIEVWTRNLWLPGVYGRENALNGYMGCVPKGAYKKDIEQLIGLLFQPLDGQNPNLNGQTMNVDPNLQNLKDLNQGQQNGPIMVQGVDVSRYATMALVFGIISICIGWYIPIVGIIFGSLGIVYGKKGSKSAKSGKATAGFVTGIIGIVISALFWILNIILLL